MKNEEKEIYISHKMAGLILEALCEEDESKKNIAKEEIAKTLFDGDLSDSEELLKLCEKKEMQALLQEIVYWDSEAGDEYHMGKYYNYCLPLLKEYAEKTGYYIRWKAYNERSGKPIPEDDIETWKPIGNEENGNKDPYQFLKNIMDKEISVKDLALYAESESHAASIATAYYDDDTVELNQKGYEAAERIIADLCFDGNEAAADGFISIMAWFNEKNLFSGTEGNISEELPF